MAEQIPEGAIPEEEFNPTHLDVPPGAIPEEEFQRNAEARSGTGMLKTAIEQLASGATLGASKVLETRGIPELGVAPITTPEAISAREKANPLTATGANIIGTGAMLGATGGLGYLGEGAGVATRIGLGSLEGGIIGGANQLTDDWSQNKSLDAQKIAASAGLGALLGGAGTAIGEGIAARREYKLAKVSESLENQAANAAETEAIAQSAPVDPAPEFKGVKATTYEDIANRVKESIERGDAVPIPSQSELDSALSRVELANPVNPLQRDSLSSQQARDIYRAAKETPDEVGQVLSNYEGLQKAELVDKTAKTIKDIAPNAQLTSDAYESGKQAVGAFTKQYQSEKEALSPIFKSLKELPVQGDILPAALTKMTESVPGIANMFDFAENQIAVRPYRTSWGIDKATYNAAKEAFESLSEGDNTLQSLWNIRKGLDQHVDVLAQGQAPAEIRALKSGLMDLMQESSGNSEIRDAFKRYAINEQQRQVIEKSFGASVGSKEFGQISKVNPERIGDKIFGSTATVEAAKKILPREEFQTILGNWLSEAKEAATDKGVFSSNKFARFLRTNQDALNVAFQDQPGQLQNLKDLTTIARIIPDDASINPSGTAKTLVRMIKDHDALGQNLHNITWEGLLLKIPHKVASEISKTIKMNELNQFLSGVALKNSQQNALKMRSAKVSESIEQGIKTLFSSSASQARKFK